jgi:anaerobic ribonucleoside-triphosphate reductase activating protein
MNYVQILDIDTINGPGIRTTLFVSGCTIHCKGCFNKDYWDFNYGKEFTQETMDELLSKLSRDAWDGLSILGGEPMDNFYTVLNICKAVKEKYPNKNIWIWSGYTKDYIEQHKKEIITYVDCMVLGPFVEEKRNLNLKFRGSENQHIFKVEDSKLVLIE